MNKEREETFRDGKILQIADNFYVCFSQGEMPNDLIDSSKNIEDAYILSYDTRINELNEMCKEIIDLIMKNDIKTVALIVYMHNTEKEHIVNSIKTAKRIIDLSENRR